MILPSIAGTEFAIESNRTGVKFFVSSDPYVFYYCDSQSKYETSVVITNT